VAKRTGRDCNLVCISDEGDTGNEVEDNYDVL
jgi:hypothetical protein